MLFNSTAPHGSRSIPNNVLSTSRSGGMIREKMILGVTWFKFQALKLDFSIFFFMLPLIISSIMIKIK